MFADGTSMFISYRKFGYLRSKYKIKLCDFCSTGIIFPFSHMCNVYFQITNAGK